MDTTESLPVLYVRARNNYEAGKAIGSTFKGMIIEYLETAKDVKLFRRFYQTANGRAAYDGHLNAAQKCHPNIVSEIRGMADGANQSFEDMFLLELCSEIRFCYSASEVPQKELYEQVNSGKGCTDVLVNNEGFRMIAHNEDWDIEVSKFVYVVHVTIDDTDDSIVETEDKLAKLGESTRYTPPQQFVSYAYPGYLAGFAFSMNKKLVFTLNTLFPPQAVEGAVPIAILLRALLGCDTIEECAAMMKNDPVGCAYGMNINIASTDGTDMCSMEVYPDPSGTKVHIHRVPYGGDGNNPSYFFHQNHYKHLEVDKSSTWKGTKLREKRCNEMGAPQSARDVKLILGDTEDPFEPIYRIPCDKHYSKCQKTSATALFNLTERQLEIYRSNPKKAKQPCIVLPFL